jgi:hypothetical protein
MNRTTRNLLGVAGLVAIWTLLLDDETRAVLAGEKKRAAIDADFAQVKPSKKRASAGVVEVAKGGAA